MAPSSADSEAVTAPAETNAAEASPQDSPSWLDTGHGFVTARADGLTQWFDSYFGGGDSEDTEASSRLRLRLINDWDQRLGNNVRVGVGGKVNLPEISKRLDLVFGERTRSMTSTAVTTPPSPGSPWSSRSILMRTTTWTSS